MKKISSFTDVTLDRQITEIVNEFEALGNKPLKSIVLVAPNGNKYKITVSNAGALTATAI